MKFMEITLHIFYKFLLKKPAKPYLVHGIFIFKYIYIQHIKVIQIAS